MSTLLVVEDEEHLAFALRFNLEEEGHDVVVASTLDRAWQCVDSEPYDFVILDVMLPGLDGLAILRHLRADPKTHAIPIVLLTTEYCGSKCSHWFFVFANSI